MRRRQLPSNDPTMQARQVWRYLFDSPWPQGWTVVWVRGLHGNFGQARRCDRRILLNYPMHLATPIDRAMQRMGRALRAWRHHPEAIDRFADAWAKWLASEPKNEPESILDTLIHEFIHVRHRNLKHGAEFSRMVKWGLTKLGLHHS